ncbi:MAG: hypothetical protein P8180_07570 [Gammaproteobacteria bacterium]
MSTDKVAGSNPLVGAVVGDTVGNVCSVIEALELIDVTKADGSPIDETALWGVRAVLECVVDALRYEMDNYENRAGTLCRTLSRSHGGSLIAHPGQLRVGLARNLLEVQRWIDDISSACAQATTDTTN